MSQFSSIGIPFTTNTLSNNSCPDKCLCFFEHAPTRAAVIKAGDFSTELHNTNYKVQIFAPKPSKVIAKLDENGPGGGPRVEELLPPRYNIQSELLLDVNGPTKSAKFELRSR